MALVVTALAIIGDILVEILEAPPAVKVVPEVVEFVDVLLGGVGIAKGGDGVCLGETGLGLEDLAPELVEVALLQLLLGGGLDVGLLVDGVELAASDGVEQNVGGLLDTLEELVVLGTAQGSLLIGVVLEDLLAVGLLDLLLGGLVAVLGEAKNLVVVLSLCVSVSTGRIGLAIPIPISPPIMFQHIPSSPWPGSEASWGPQARSHRHHRHPRRSWRSPGPESGHPRKRCACDELGGREPGNAVQQARCCAGQLRRACRQP